MAANHSSPEWADSVAQELLELLVSGELEPEKEAHTAAIAQAAATLALARHQARFNARAFQPGGMLVQIRR